MDWLNQAKRFLGNLFGGAQKTIGQISGNVAKAVGQAEQQAARVAQQAVQRVVPQAPRIQLPQVPRIQFPQIQLPQPPRVQLPQAPKIDLAAVSRALGNYYNRTALSKVAPGIQRELPKIDRNIQSFNERLLGGIGRTAIRTGEFVLPGKTENISEAMIQRLFPEAGTAAGRRGLTPLADPRSFGGRLGTGAKAAVDVAGIVLPSTAATNVLKGTQIAQKGLQAGRLARLGTLAATEAIGGIPASAASIAQARGQQKPVDLKKEIGTGLLIDAATPLGIKLLGKGYRAIRGAISNVPGAVVEDAAKNIPGIKSKNAIEQAIISKTPVDKTAPVVARSLAEKGALRAQGYTNVRVEFQPKPGQVAPTMRGAIPQVAPKAPKGQEAIYAEARKFTNATDFVNSKLPNTSIFDPRKAELRTLWEKANADVIAQKQATLAERRLAREQNRSAPNPEKWVAQKPIKMPTEVYRGVGKEGGTGMSMFGSGLYTAAARKEAAKYGKVNKFGADSLPKNPLQFRNEMDFKQWEYEMARKMGISRKDLYAPNTGVESLVKPLGYDGITIGQGKEMIAVKYAEKPTLPIKPIYETAPKPTVAPKGESSLADIQMSVAPKPPKTQISPKAQELKAQFLNRFDSVERFVRNIELERGSKLKPSENPMYYVKQFMGGGGIANYRIDNELTPILKQTKNFYGLRQYLIARRMNVLADRGIGKKANTAITELTQKYGPDEIANFDKIATQLYGYQRNQLDQLLATGVISKQSYDNIIAKNPFYIPFNRVIPDVIAETTQGGQKISGAKKLGSLKEIKGSEKAIIDPIESLIKNTYDVQATVAKQKVLNSLVALAPDEFKPLPKGASLKAPAIELFSNGKRIKLSADPQLAKALNAMDEEQLNLVVRAMSLPAKTLRAGATSLNVAFAIPNVLRDQLSAAVNSKYGGIPIYDFISGLSSVLKKDDSYKKWILSGADQATLFSQDRTTLMRGVKDITGGVGYKAGKLVKSPLELFRIFGDLSEKGSRLGVFKRALKGAKKEGLNAEDALLTAMRESREATIDFAQRGSKMKAFNAMVPFLNARVQGTLKLAQSFKNRPIQTMMRGAGIISIPSVILYIHNNAQGNAEVYKEIPEYVKRENFIIVTGDKNTPFIKIPKGEVGKIFANPVESFMAQINNDSTNWSETAKSLADAFLPVGSVSEPSRFLTDVIPTAIGVPLQVATNYDIFRGQNIVGQYQKDLPAAQQYSRYNTETAKKIGELLNISPAQLEFVLGGYTGGLGRQALQMADIAQGKMPAVQELPVLSRFLGEQKDLSASAQEIYKQAEKAKMEKARENYAIKQALKKGDTNVLEGVDKTTATRLKRSVAEDEAKKDLSPIQKALFDLPQAQFDALKATGKNANDIAVVENIKNQIDSSLKKGTTPKIKIPSAKVVKAKSKKGKVAKQKRISLKTPRLRRISISVPKARKVSFKQPTPTKARKSIKIKTG